MKYSVVNEQHYLLSILFEEGFVIIAGTTLGKDNNWGEQIDQTKIRN